MTDQELNNFIADKFKVPVQEWVEGKALIPLSQLPKEEGLAMLKVLMPELSKQFYSGGDSDPYLFYWLVMTIPNRTITQALVTMKGSL